MNRCLNAITTAVRGSRHYNSEAVGPKAFSAMSTATVMIQQQSSFRRLRPNSNMGPGSNSTLSATNTAMSLSMSMCAAKRKYTLRERRLQRLRALRGMSTDASEAGGRGNIIVHTVDAYNVSKRRAAEITHHTSCHPIYRCI